MSAPRTNNRKRWYCIEIVDEREGVHSVLSLYTDEARATTVLREADRRLPRSAHIYYWASTLRPVGMPPAGYAEGPMARPGGPSAH